MVLVRKRGLIGRLACVCDDNIQTILKEIWAVVGWIWDRGGTVVKVLCYK